MGGGEDVGPYLFNVTPTEKFFILTNTEKMTFDKLILKFSVHFLLINECTGVLRYHFEVH